MQRLPIHAQDLSLPAINQHHVLDAGDRLRGRRRSRDGELELSPDLYGASIAGDIAESTGSPARKRRRSRKGHDKMFECQFSDCGRSYSRAEHLHRHQLNHTRKQIYMCDFPGCSRSFVRHDLRARHRERHSAKQPQPPIKDEPSPRQNNISGENLSNSSFKQESIKHEHKEQEFMKQETPNYESLRQESVLPAAIKQEALKRESPGVKADSLNSPIDEKSYGNGSHGVPPQPSPSRSQFDTLSPISANPSVTIIATNSSTNTSAPADQGSARKTWPASTAFGSEDHYQRTNRTRGYNPPQATQSMPIPSIKHNHSHSAFDTSVTHVSSQAPPNAYHRPTAAHAIPLGMQGLSLAPSYSSNPTPQSYSEMTKLNSGPPIGNFPHTQPHYIPHNALAPFPLTSSGFQPINLTPPITSENSYAIAVPATHAPLGQSSCSDAAMVVESQPLYALPAFGDAHMRWPWAQAEDFAAWLFGEPNAYGNPVMPAQLALGRHFADNTNMHFGFYSHDHSMSEFYGNVPQQHSMAVNSILDRSELTLSEDMRKSLIKMIMTKFQEPSNRSMEGQKEVIFRGDPNDSNHVMSSRWMRQYLHSYWFHFHPQLPILHKPSFVADETPDLLLLAMLTLGASCLDKMSSSDAPRACSDLSNFLAWNLRTELFSSPDFGPPGKLWVFQASLLLEIYEKMYATRKLHERAHIHHYTTITLMRRGSALIEGSQSDFPSTKENRYGHGSGGSSSNIITPDEWWSNWIQTEATHRVVFAAFVIDSIHASMFGHSAIMVAHEMRLPLPCDEQQWAATSGAEVARLRADLKEKGIKPVMFLEGLKKTLGGISVRTNTFGRTILMTGLLSVTWFMNQKDLQINALNSFTVQLEQRDKWRLLLTNAFDLWKVDFDKSLEDVSESSTSPYDLTSSVKGENIYDSCEVLHHLAHMAMHADILDCQMYAGASRLLSRAINTPDQKSAESRIKNWATSLRARDAAFYALSFLNQVLAGTVRQYSARDDFLLNRPWTLYFAALIVWSYGFALEGPILASRSVPLNSIEQKEADMRAYLKRMSSVRSPEDLKNFRGVNGCAGTLLTLKDTFLMTRWELLHEASNLLGRCAKKMLQHSEFPLS